MITACDAAVVGAGPHGLATAAHLRAAGLDTRVFGRTMSFWREHMPDTMQLRSSVRASSIASPGRAWSLGGFAAERERRLVDPLPVTTFLEYGRWFQQRAVPDVDQRLVTAIEPKGARFELSLDDGERLTARRVVVAAGIVPFAYRPPEFSELPLSLASHSLDHATFAGFAGQRVLVVGAGQSALESAALLREDGARVEVVVRAPSIRWLDPARRGLTGVRRLLQDLQHPPTEVGPRGLNWIAAIPDLFRLVPRPLKAPVGRRCIAPAGSDWLRSRLADVPITVDRQVATAGRVNGHVVVELDDASVRRVDHVLLATGYRVDLSRYAFLPQGLVRALRMRNGYPILSKGLETSLPGLHVVGAPASLSAGPIMRFVCGTWYAAPTVTERVLGCRYRPLRRAW
jgi:lysine/ornithine N-monooxygenase